VAKRKNSQYRPTEKPSPYWIKIKNNCIRWLKDDEIILAFVCSEFGMILVIFGAGASYDSVPSRTPDRHPRALLYSRPPLARELFLGTDFFMSVLSRFPGCHPIVPYLQAAGGGSIRTGTFWSNDSTGDLQLASRFGRRLTRMDRIVVAIDEMF